MAKKKLTLDDIIAMADRAYADNLIIDHWDKEKQEATTVNERGDTYALAIVRELKDTYDDDASNTEKVEAARDAIHGAVMDLEGVMGVFEDYDPEAVYVEIDPRIKEGTDEFRAQISAAIPKNRKMSYWFEPDTSYRHGNNFWVIKFGRNAPKQALMDKRYLARPDPDFGKKKKRRYC